MNSIFLFSKCNSPIKEVHFNLWMTDDKESFIDIGLKIKKGQRLVLYLPWENADVEDLYEIIKCEDVLDAIFNEHLAISRTSDDAYLTVSRSNEKFDVVRACIHTNKIKIQNSTNHSDYTRLTVEANPQGQNIDIAYVRLRARGFKRGIFNREHSIKPRWLSPYKESIEAIDFRVNELRTVKQSDLDREKDFKIPKIGTLHFFLLKHFSELSTIVSPNYDRCRELEDKAWDKYLCIDHTDDKALAYHWKKNKIEEEQHFSVLATFATKKVSVWTLTFYIAVLIGLNILSSWICSWIDFLCP